MDKISIIMAMTLTGWSKRTLWRRISDGTVTRDTGLSPVEQKANVCFSTIEPHIYLALDADDFDVIEKADMGDSEAQTDLAILLLRCKKFQNATYWLESAAKKNDANAMYLLGRCYLDGSGVDKNDNLGIMWIAKAAAYSHKISQGLIRSIQDSFTQGIAPQTSGQP